MWGRSGEFHGEPSSAVTMVTMAGVSGQGSRAQGVLPSFIGTGRRGGQTGEGAARARREARGGRRLGASLGHGDGVASRGACRGAWQLDAEPGRSGLGELVLGEVRS